jgi:16S rRNA A1518/A1519 N6-dimethyltransferase RsmA/KsgA/DIM1 with predicted DNA glycosylase/AP lyase activity
MDEHFLIDKKIITASVDALSVVHSDSILEIGAGHGVISKELIKTGAKIYLSETNKDFCTELNSTYKTAAVVYPTDALTLSWKPFTKIIGNIPFTLSEALFIKLLKNSQIQSAVFFIGEEFYKKLSDSKTKTGLLSRLFFSVEKISDVPNTSFSPVPRTSSVLIKILPNQKMSIQSEIIKEIATSSGKIKNAIIRALIRAGKTKNQAREIIEKSGLDKETIEKPTIKLTPKLIGKIIALNALGAEFNQGQK